MALEEISFFNTNGEEISLSNLVNQMVNYYQMKLEVGETAVTDFNEGSEIRNLLEAFAVGIYALLDEQHEATRIAFISTSEGGFLDRIGELPFIDLPRIDGAEAVGEVTFTLSEAQTTETIIPAGTIVASSDTGLEYTTDDDCIIDIGSLTGEISVTCLTVGSDGNASSGSIDTIVDTEINTDLISVSNNEAFEAGSDYEDDDDYRERLLANVRADGFGTIGWYINLCEAIDGVHDVLLIDDENYTKKVLVNGTSKPTPDSILLEVLTELTDVSNKVLNHTFTVGKPVYTTVNLAISLDVTAELTDEELLDNLTAYIDGLEYDRMEYSGLNINDDLTKDMVVEACSMFGDVVDVTSVKANSSSSEMTTVSPASNGVLKLGTVTFIQNEV